MKKGRPPIKVKRPLAYTLLNFIYKASLPLLCHILLVSQCYLSIVKGMDTQEVQNKHGDEKKLVDQVVVPGVPELAA